MIINVIPETKAFSKTGFFSYAVPAELISKIKIGTVVRIPFGKRKIRGLVESIEQNAKKTKYQIKNIDSVIDDYYLPESYLKIIHWISEYYLCSLGEALELFLPPDLKRPRAKSKIQNPNVSSNPNVKLNTEQKAIFDQLSRTLLDKNKKPALIYGVTGSGKTEIYIKLAKETLKIGKSVVLLLPEIVLTPQNIERFEAVFGDQICIMHSGLSKSERLQCYLDFQKGEKKIIVGPRSALLVPNENIGLIIIDEEQEDSYKQDQNPRYHSVDLAEKIAVGTNSLLLLGSATPRIETFYKAKNSIYYLFELKGRYNTLMLPVAETVDLRNEIKHENFSPISIKLQKAISLALSKKEQVLLFLNRRGSSTFVSCRDCGFVVSCDRCDVPLIYHTNNHFGYLTCHHCDKKFQIPTKCPECNSAYIRYFGAGVEKIEDEIKRLFPKAKIKRVDAKVLRNHTEYEEFYKDFRDHKFDIVIGTQILAKGFDIPGVSLVGIVSADVGLHLPHFRAGERIFRLITQVSGRSGRRNKTGKTVIQSYWPNSAAIKFASTHDFVGFYETEIIKREKRNYPPFSHIIRVLSENRDNKKAKEEISKLADELNKNGIEYIGPGICFFQRLHNRWRYQIIIKINNLPDKNISKLHQKYSNLVWDIDAINLL